MTTALSLLSNASMNTDYVEMDRFNILNDDTFSEASDSRLNKTTNDNILLNSSMYDTAESAKNNKFNSFPMRQKKKPSKASLGHMGTLKNNQNGLSSADQPPLIVFNEDELNLTVRLARTRAQESTRLKQLLRTNCWPARHPIRKYLWKCLLQLSSNNNQSSANKENNNKVTFNTGMSLSSYETEYNKHLNQIFGKCKFKNI